MNGVTIITLNRSLYSCLRSCLVNPGVASLCIFTYCTLLSHIYCCTNPVVMFILACLHDCITHTHSHACARRLRRHFTTRSGLFLTTPDLYVQIPEQTAKDFPHLPEHWNGPRSKSSAWRTRLPTSAAAIPGCSSWSAFSVFPRSSCAAFYGIPQSLFILYFCIFVLSHSPSLLTCNFGTP